MIRQHVRRARPRRILSLFTLALACAMLSFALDGLQTRARAAATFVVTNTDDLGPGSLRQAINDANNNPGPDTITFQIGSGPKTIRPSQPLPALTEPATIDATTQPGYAGSPVIELDGSLAAPGNGLTLAGGDSTVRGLVVNGFRFDGISTGLKGGNRIEGCYIGTDITGTLARPNGSNGISIPGSNNRVGGTEPGARNVISGNGGAGVSVQRFCCTGDSSPIAGNVISGNYVGLNAAGDAALPNGGDGVLITSVNSNVAVNGNVVGGAAAGARNVISGNRGIGVFLDGASVNGNAVQGNFIGTDATGGFAVANDSDGVRVTGSDNLVGGSTPAARNVISGNGRAGSGASGGNGVSLGTRSGNVVRGNVIGANAALTAPLPNLLSGVWVGGTNTVVGGTGTGDGNVIAFNGFDGVFVATPSSAGNSLRGNSIFSNGLNTYPLGAALGIDLGPDGPTVNDSGDADEGANGLQNFPLLSSVTAGANGVNVKGTLSSAAATAYDLDFYASGACDPSGFGEGARRVGSARVTTDSGGQASFDLNFNVSLAPGQVLTATATDPSGNTSEFSDCWAPGEPVGSVGFESTSVEVSEGGGAATFVLTRSGGSAGTLTIGYAVRGLTARAGVDFAPTQGTLTFADGETSKTFTVAVNEDAVSEPFLERALVTLSTTGDLDALGSRSTATLLISDNDPTPSVSVGDVSAAEGDFGTTSFEFPVTLSAASEQDVTVNFNTSSGTAGGGGDDFFLPAVNSLTIPAGQTSGKITISVIADTLTEPDENFFVNLTSAGGAVIADGQGQGTILNDDGTPTVSLSIDDVTVTEGNGGTTNAIFTATLSAASEKTVKVDVITLGDTASTGVDFQGVSVTLTFAPGERTKTISVPVMGDNVYEGDETFRVEFRNPVNALVADGSGLGTILDDEAQPSLSVEDLTVAEGDNGTTDATFRVTLSGPSSRNVVFFFHTAGGTAKTDEDFSETAGGAMIGVNGTSTLVTVRVIGDTIAEPDETFFLDITGATDASVAKPRGACTIKDNDGASGRPTLQFDVRQRSVSEGAGAVAVTVTRSGDASLPVSVDYATRTENAVFAASDRGDYTPAAGTLRFASGETSKSFNVLLTDDGYDEPDEFIIVALSNPSGGAALGLPDVGRIDLLDNDDSTSATNPADDTRFFVRQHYHDFLSREPDAAGFDFWTNEIEKCGADAQCREVKRINVSAAFFLSIEFQETGYFVYRFYKAAYGDAVSPGVAGTVPVVRMSEFLPDTQRIAQGVQVNVGEWQQQLESNKGAYAIEFVQRQRFLSAFPATMTADAFVSKLDQNAGSVLAAEEKAQLVSALAAAPSDPQKRADVLRQVAENAQLRQRELNRAFVLMQYFGYLRRDPDAAPDADFRGWRFWLDKLEEFGGNFVRAEMVKAFLNSDEYRRRFGQR